MRFFLLSDGEFDDGTLEFLRQFNVRRVEDDQIREKTVIHTIALKSEIGGPMLRRIAKENNGQYTLVR